MPVVWPSRKGGYWLNLHQASNISSIIISAAVNVYSDEFELLVSKQYPSALDGYYIGQLYGNQWVEDANGKYWVLYSVTDSGPTRVRHLIRLSLTSDAAEEDHSLPTPSTPTDGVLMGPGGNVPFALNEQSQPYVPTHAGLRRLDPDDGSVQETILWPRTLVVSPSSSQWSLTSLVGGKDVIMLQIKNVNGSSQVTYEFYTLPWGSSTWTLVQTEFNVNPDLRHLFTADPLQVDGEDTFAGVAVFNSGSVPQQFWFMTASGVRTVHPQTGSRQYAVAAMIGDHAWVQRGPSTGTATMVDFARYSRSGDAFEIEGQTPLGFFPTNQSPWRTVPEL